MILGTLFATIRRIAVRFFHSLHDHLCRIFPRFRFSPFRATISLFDKRKRNSFRTYTFSSFPANIFDFTQKQKFRLDTLSFSPSLYRAPELALSCACITSVYTSYIEECVSRRGISRRAVEKVNRIDGVNDDVPHSARLRFFPLPLFAVVSTTL